jgi:hypothetical protein
MESVISLLLTFTSIGAPLLMPFVLVGNWRGNIVLKVLFVCTGVIMGFFLSRIVQIVPLGAMVGLTSADHGSFGYSVRYWLIITCYISLTAVVQYVLLGLLGLILGFDPKRDDAGGSTSQ